MPVSARWILLTLLAWFAAAPAGAAGKDWTPVRKVEGITVEARATESGFNEHRGTARLCTQIDVLEALISETSRIPEWLPYTREAQLLEASADAFTYYVRTSSPWPLKDRDMVYRVTRAPAGDDGVLLTLAGMPDQGPKHRGVIRIREASGEWRLLNADEGLMVSYRLFVDPGPVPAFAANGRLATTVGQTLANLVSRYPCEQT